MHRYVGKGRQHSHVCLPLLSWRACSWGASLALLPVPSVGDCPLIPFRFSRPPPGPLMWCNVFISWTSCLRSPNHHVTTYLDVMGFVATPQGRLAGHVQPCLALCCTHLMTSASYWGHNFPNTSYKLSVPLIAPNISM